MSAQPPPPASVRILSVLVAALIVASTAVGVFKVTEPDDTTPAAAPTTTFSTTTTTSTTPTSELPPPESGITPGPPSSVVPGGATRTTARSTATTRAATTSPTTGASGGGGITFTHDPNAETAQTAIGIYTVRADGTTLRRIRSGSFTFLSWAPAGSRLAYGPRATVMNGDGSGARDLIPGVLVAPPAWSPDGNRLALVLQNGGKSDLVVIGADGSGARGLTTSGDVSGVSWSSSGTLAYLAGGKVLVVQPDGTGLRQLVETDIAYRAVAWSPNGQWLAFANGTEVWVVNAAGSDVRPVGLTDGHVLRWAEITWSPDSTRLVFQAGTGGASRIRVVGYDGTGLKTVAEDVMSPDWSPVVTNRVAVFGAGRPLQNGDRVSDLDLANPDRPGFRQRIVNDRPGADQTSGPQYSPDGTLLAFAIGGGDRGGPARPGTA